MGLRRNYTTEEIQKMIDTEDFDGLVKTSLAIDLLDTQKVNEDRIQNIHFTNWFIAEFLCRKGGKRQTLLNGTTKDNLNASKSNYRHFFGNIGERGFAEEVTLDTWRAIIEAGKFFEFTPWGTNHYGRSMVEVLLDDDLYERLASSINKNNKLQPIKMKLNHIKGKDVKLLFERIENTHIYVLIYVSNDEDPTFIADAVGFSGYIEYLKHCKTALANEKFLRLCNVDEILAITNRIMQLNNDKNYNITHHVENITNRLHELNFVLDDQNIEKLNHKTISNLNTIVLSHFTDFASKEFIKNHQEFFTIDVLLRSKLKIEEYEDLIDKFIADNVNTPYKTPYADIISRRFFTEEEALKHYKYIKLTEIKKTHTMYMSKEVWDEILKKQTGLGIYKRVDEPFLTYDDDLMNFGKLINSANDNKILNKKALDYIVKKTKPTFKECLDNIDKLKGFYKGFEDLYLLNALY